MNPAHLDIHGLVIGAGIGVIKDLPENFEQCKNIFEGISITKNNFFDHIFVIYSAIGNQKQQALETLGQAALGSHIHLLIEMYQEPEVIELSQSIGCLFDYYISPLEIQPLLRLTASAFPTSGSSLTTESDKDRRIRQLEILVTQDDLTGLKNRRYIRQFLPTILRRAQEKNCQVTLLLFDIDNFKHYNDSYGHPIGDKVLRQTARLISRCCRSQDVVARLGGDEFAVIFWDAGDNRPTGDLTDRRSSSQGHPREAVFMSERFCKEMSEASFEVLGPRGKGSLTISGGLATYPRDAQSPEELFDKADQAMLEAKRNGKNRIYLVGEPG